MNPRLQVLNLPGEKYAIVLDRYGASDHIDLEEAESVAESLGAVGFIVFYDEVDVQN